MPNYISWPAGFDISINKLTIYLLDPIRGDAGKAKFFLGHGFHPKDSHLLEAELFAHTSLTNCAGIKIRPRGFNIIFLGPISTPNGTTPRIRSVWHVPAAGSGRAEFATAYPK